MKNSVTVAFLSSVAIVAFTTPAIAAPADPPRTAWEASRAVDENDMVTTGVARGRDRLDSATSTSAIKESEIAKIGARSLADLFRNIPGFHVEASTGDSNASYTVRGLPLVYSGSKYLQIQEDGLPVMEFGDFLHFTPDLLVRADFNVGQVEAIRGGSASTFASNAPGGVVNLISKTGDVEGGSFQAGTGLDHDLQRADFDYGGKLGDSWRFHVGGFYREGEGPRRVGYDAYQGGQVKLNVTRQFDGGYIRFNAKVLDDTIPYYQAIPVLVSGTDADPQFRNVPNFSVSKDGNTSRYIGVTPAVDTDNTVTAFDAQQGFHIRATSLGLETQFKVAGWSVTERLRYSRHRGTAGIASPIAILPAGGDMAGPGGQLRYASGPLAGQVIANPAALNGNGLMMMSTVEGLDIRSLDNVTNDIRVSRVWSVEGGDLTTTFGLYNSRQDLDYAMGFDTILLDVAGKGRAATLDLVTAGGFPVTQQGVLAFGTAGYNRVFDVRYRVTAPYASFNFHKGRIAIGGSVRYDNGKASGTIRGSSAADVRPFDVNGDGSTASSAAEQAVVFTPFTSIQPVDYSYDYLSYSTGINFRVAEPFAIFARYSRGARGGADRLLFSPAVSPTDGSLAIGKAAYDPVRQAELGAKYRKNGLTLNVTGFWARAGETNTQLNPDVNGTLQLELISRVYRAYGVELEGGIRRGPFSLTAGATLTKAEISAADNHPELVGKTPRHQAALIFQATPQYDTELFTIGANFVGTTSSYAQDTNQLRMPGYTTVGAFVQVRPAERVEFALNARNLFDVRAITDIAAGTIPASGAVLAQTLYGRTISTSVRFFF